MALTRDQIERRGRWTLRLVAVALFVAAILRVLL